MSNLLEQASLVMIPSGYKEDVVYSEIPTSGAGDLTFTRASNGTRIDSNGNVEVVPWNLLQNSENFTSGWGASNTVVTANQTTAPNGTTTADLIVDNTNNTSHSLTQSVTNLSVGLDYYYSIYVKNNNHTWVALRHDNGGTFNYFNISTGVKGTNTQANSTIENVGNGWYKLTVPFNVASSSSGPEFYLANADGTYIYAGTGTGVYIWGASYTLSAKPYFPTTDRLNVPRLTYQNGGGGCPSLLLEKQSTNLFTYSEQFDNAAWIKNNITITANAITSPDGTQNADKIADSINTASAFYFYQSVATSGTQYTSSGYFKKGEYNFVTLHAFGLNGAVFNLNTGVKVSQSGGTGTITSVGDGWYRCTFTFTAGGSAVFFSQSPAGNISYTGTIGSGIYAWGLQCEASSYATSYIPTTSSSATRVADECRKSSISSLIGQTEGTLYFELQRDNTDNDTRLQISDGTTNNWLFVSIETGLNPRAYCNVGGVNQFSVYGSAVSNSTHKVAFAYKSNDFKVYIDGVASITQTSGSVPACNQIDVGNGTPNGPVVSTSVIKEVVLFPTRLTNAELASLTTI